MGGAFSLNQGWKLSQSCGRLVPRMVPNGDIFFRMCFPPSHLCAIHTQEHTRASDSAQWAAEGKTHDGFRLLCSWERDPFSPVLRRQAEVCCFLLRPRRCQALCQAWRQYFLHRATAPPGTSDKVCRHFGLFPVGGKGCCSHGVERSQGWWC